MTYPALHTFAADPERTYSRWCVLMALQPPVLSFTEPKDLKVEAVARMARISTSTAGDALAWLFRRGYLVVHARDRRGMPSVTIAYARVEPVHDFQDRTA